MSREDPGTSPADSDERETKIQEERKNALNLRSVNVRVAGRSVPPPAAQVTEVPVQAPKRTKVRTNLGDNVIYPATAAPEFELARDQKLRLLNQRYLGVKHDGTLDNDKRAPRDDPVFDFDGSASVIK